MNENSTHTELLVQYLGGELEGTELEKLKINLANDPSLRDELENLQFAREAARRYGLKSKISNRSFRNDAGDGR
jgi:hypothetical protein